MIRPRRLARSLAAEPAVTAQRDIIAEGPVEQVAPTVSDEDVVATTKHDIVVPPAEQQVVPDIAAYGVVAPTGQHEVVTASGPHHVARCGPNKQIAARRPEDRWMRAVAERSREKAAMGGSWSDALWPSSSTPDLKKSVLTCA